MNIKPKQFLLIGGILSFSFFCIYISLFLFQLKSPVNAEYWINSTYHYKDFRAQNIKSKKIIIIGGSNSLFGINSEKIEEVTGYPVVNLAVHASLDINFLYYKIKKHIKKDDILVLPLELDIYTKPDQISGWFSNNMMAWGLDYLKQMSLIELFDFIITTEKKRVLKGVRDQLKSNSTNKKILSKKEVLTTLDKLWLEDGEKWRGYSYKSLNKFGDINVDKAVIYNEEGGYLARKNKLSSHFLNNYKKIEELTKQFNASLYLTYPVTIRNKLFDLSKKDTQDRILFFETLLNKHNITISCNPALFNLERVFFFNTAHHTNKYGALIRSENLAHCINRLENSIYKKYSYNEAIKKTNILQEKYINKVKHPEITFLRVDQNLIKM